MNITELARQLKVSPEVLRRKLPELGFDIGARAIKIDAKVAAQVMKAWREMESRQRQHENLKSKSTDVKKDSQSTKTKVVELPPLLTVMQFAQLIDFPVVKVVTELMRNGVMASLHEKIDYETAHIIAEDLGVATKPGLAIAPLAKGSKNQRQVVADLKETAGKSLSRRPPVVVVMGHVDHGKTTLLDAIRKTDVVAAEAGGITQRISAYQIKWQEQAITFIDTPGHQLFSAMRSRGSQVADVAILVVAADDGLKPQTLESISVIQREGLKFVVAINKVDKETADIDRVKTQLSEMNLLPQDWGGSVLCLPISALKGEGLNELLAAVLKEAQDLDLEVAHQGEPVATVVEAHVDPGQGVVANLIVHSGALVPGQLVKVGSSFGKIRVLKDFQGQLIKQAQPAQPVVLLGLKDLPATGDLLRLATKKELKDSQKNYKVKLSADSGGEVKSLKKKQVTGDPVHLNLIIKADVLGVLEAVLQLVSQLDHQNVDIKILYQGLGAVTENDILLAEKEAAWLIAFNVKPSSKVRNLLADRKQVVYKEYQVVYNLIEDLEAELKRIAPTQIIETKLGQATIKGVFQSTAEGLVVGGVVDSGLISVGSLVRVLDGDLVVSSGKVVNLQQHKVEVKEVLAGSDFGVKLEGVKRAEEGYLLEVFSREEV